MVSVAESHRRERKKRQMRDALVHAALKLFLAKGYEHTAVREITDAVDVSERTFFRYFANKEDLAVSFVRDASDALIRELAVRPPEEEPLVALRNAFHTSLRAVTADDASPGEESVYLLIMKLIDATPSLLAAHLRYLHDRDDEIVRVLGERKDVNRSVTCGPDTPGRIRRPADHSPPSSGGPMAASSVAEMLAAVDACLAQVEPGARGTLDRR